MVFCFVKMVIYGMCMCVFRRWHCAAVCCVRSFPCFAWLLQEEQHSLGHSEAEFMSETYSIDTYLLSGSLTAYRIIEETKPSFNFW